MSEPCSSPRQASPARAADVLTAAGAWAFENRSWLPVPLAIALVVVKHGASAPLPAVVLGGLLVACGIALRAWAVRQIGVISRTRAARIGPLVTTGPYAFVRHPLYAANFLLWTGFVIASEVPWMLPLAWTVFAVEYGAIVLWEESRLTVRYPDEYPAYCARVRRWWPGAAGGSSAAAVRLHPWPEVFFSERGTLLGIAAMATLLAVKALLL